MKKIIVPAKAERTEAIRASRAEESAPRQRLGLRYGGAPEPRDRP